MKSKRSLCQNLNKFLLMYRNTPHSVTNEPPSLLFLGLRLRMQLDLLRPNLKQYIDNKASNLTKCNRPISGFNVGDKVAVCDYRKSSGGERWQTSVILSRLGKYITK